MESPNPSQRGHFISDRGILRQWVKLPEVKYSILQYMEAIGVNPVFPLLNKSSRADKGESTYEFRFQQTCLGLRKR